MLSLSRRDATRLEQRGNQASPSHTYAAEDSDQAP